MNTLFRIYSISFVLTLFATSVYAQHRTITGTVRAMRTAEVLPYSTVIVAGTGIGATTDANGWFTLNIPFANESHKLIASYIGYISDTVLLTSDRTVYNINLHPAHGTLQEVVISGTMRESSRLESPVPVEVYTHRFFKANPTPSIFEALQNVNGVRPQINCNVCNTGDIHINGLEGPYTMVLIDGMPIVSGLSTVYGLSGIPQSLIDRVEIVKGPASTLYGSEAVGGLVNIITKKAINAPAVAFDVMGTTWGEVNTDVAAKYQTGKRVQGLVGINHFLYQNPVDHNNDNFTDVTLQNRISIFNKWNIKHNNDKLLTLAGRYVYEDRWGGEMNWTKKDRGGDEVYGESIYTKRWEFFGTYQLPVRESVTFMFSANGHDQNSVYGSTIYLADQRIAFGQLVWTKQQTRHDWLAGATYRYTYYDDNTPATVQQPMYTHLPGVFVQDEIALAAHHKLLLGLRYDYNSIHGSIVTPRANYKWMSDDRSSVLRVSLGNGYRVANVFTEDHAALTGAREVVFLHDLNPETSWNTNINLVKKIYAVKNTYIDVDATAFYTYFNNKIVADYETDPDKIIYNNLNGYAVSQGVSLNIDVMTASGLNIKAGGTYLDVYQKNGEAKIRQLFTEHFMGVWSVGYTVPRIKLTIDYTGNVYSPMKLPLLSTTDPRSRYSPWWSIQNIQLTKTLGEYIELYGGVKNLLNWTPNKGNPFIIARAHDPFDNQVEFDGKGNALPTPENPYGLTFDPSYVYGPNQGIRAFLGLRFTLNR